MTVRTAALAALAFIALGAGTGPARAEDPRLVERRYDPAQIVRVEGRVNIQSTIRFGAGETIENVAIGDSQAWQVTPNRRADLLFVKPLAPRASTNMTVVTNRHTYLFDLVASPQVRNPVYILAFTYPDPPQQADALAQAQPQEGALPPGPADPADALAMAAASDELAVLDPASLNFHWRSGGAAGLLPQRIFDNGRATFLAFAADTAMPAILVRDHTGAEGPVNFAVRGDVIVIDGVPEEIILRSGGEMAQLVNEGAAPARQGA